MAEQAAGYLWKEHGKNVAPDDFWGQVKRTINGKPVPQEQIDMIVAAMIAALDLQSPDRLLDLGCGNGALTTYFFQRCAGGLGIDFSEFLIDVAGKHFTRRPEERYLLGDIVAFVRSTPDTAGFTKALCYGVLQYLAPADAEAMLRDLRRRFPTIRRFVIGNHPNKANIARFYKDGVPDGIADRLDSPLGLWRTPEDLAALAARAGWNATFHTMPAAYHAAHYRIDAVLTPRDA